MHKQRLSVQSKNSDKKEKEQKDNKSLQSFHP